MRKRVLIKICIFLMLVFLASEIGYSYSLYHSPGSILQSPSYFSEVKNVLLSKVQEILPTDRKFFMSFDETFEYSIQRAKMQRQFVLTSA